MQVYYYEELLVVLSNPLVIKVGYCNLYAAFAF